MFIVATSAPIWGPTGPTVSSSCVTGQYIVAPESPKCQTLRRIKKKAVIPRTLQSVMTISRVTLEKPKHSGYCESVPECVRVSQSPSGWHLACPRVSQRAFQIFGPLYECDVIPHKGALHIYISLFSIGIEQFSQALKSKLVL